MTEVERNPRTAIPVAIVYFIFLFSFHYFGHYGLGFEIIAAILLFPLFGILYLVVSYKGPKKSKLYGLEKLTSYLPAVKKPTGHVEFKYKLLWTGLVVVLYFVLTNVYVYGLNTTKSIDVFQSFRAIFAGAQGSLMDLGIGPIVTASIVMQLFAGAKIFSLDLENSEDKAVYQGVQKLLIILMIFVEAIPQAFGYLVPDAGFVGGLNHLAPGYGFFLAESVIILQLFLGSYLVFLFDELVSKYGIGSGVSLFIAAGVSQQLFTGAFNWVPQTMSLPLSFNNPPVGTIPKILYMATAPSSFLNRVGIERLLFANPNPIIALIGTILIFLLVAYFQSSKIELPISHERVRGARGRYPIQLFYASNIPVILATALLANISMWTLLFWSSPVLSHVPLLGHNALLGSYPTPAQFAKYGNLISSTTPTGGLVYYLSTPRGIQDWVFPITNPSAFKYVLFGHSPLQEAVHVIAFLTFMVVASIIFAKFWIETTNMGPAAVARQIQSSGMQIPGFRRDPRIMERVLKKYIPAITIFSGAAVGLLAAGADLIGTVGNTSGTGLLLAVGIVIQFYEAMGKEQLMEMHPVIRQFFSGSVTL